MRKRIISPEYPRVGLSKILNKLLYNNKLQVLLNNQDTFTAEELAMSLGYKNLSGAAIAFVTSMKRFELITGSDNELIPSKTLNICSFKGIKDISYKVLVEKAFYPEIFSDLKATFGTRFPEIEDFIEFLRSREFTDSAIPKLIKSYYQTLFLLNEQSIESEFEIPGKLNKTEINYLLKRKADSLNNSFNVAKNKAEKGIIYNIEKNRNTLQIGIPNSFKIIITSDSRITTEKIEEIIEFLRLSKKSLPDK